VIQRLCNSDAKIQYFEGRGVLADFSFPLIIKFRLLLWHSLSLRYQLSCTPCQSDRRQYVRIAPILAE